MEGVWGAWENEDGESVVIDEESDAVALEEFVRAKNSDTPQAVVSVEVGAISYRARCASPHQLQRRAQPREARGRTSGSAGETGPRVLTAVRPALACAHRTRPNGRGTFARDV